MKINDSIKSKVDIVDKVSTAKVDTNASKKTGAAQSSNSSGEKVTLSPMSVQMQSIDSDIASKGVFDAQKVDAIKSAISSGQFKVDSEKVADGLMDTVKDLLKPKNN
jgi:negative regulator of flagellin synthesis FlgM